MISTLFISCLYLSFGLLYGSLDDHLRYFETLHHDSLRHQITKRDVTNKAHDRILEYDSHQRHFKLILHRNVDVLSSDFKAFVVDAGNRHRSIDIDGEFYRGFKESEPETSRVVAYWEGGNLISTAVETDFDVYILEPSHFHLPRSKNYSLISYRTSDLKSADTGREMRCGGALNVHMPTSHVISDEHVRHRRDLPANGTCQHVTKKWCPLLLVADHRLHKALGHDRVMSTVHHLINQVMRVNEIYTQQVFGDCQDGFGFQIQEVIVDTLPSSGYNNASVDWTYETLLDKFAEDHRGILHKFCLAHLFTAIPFDSIMGRAVRGGICHNKWNVGFTTYSRTENDIILTQEAVLITAHELGHNWGSEHDITDECVPSGSEGGKYLMYPIAVSGLDRNNKYLSVCSKLEIERYLKLDSSKCFREKSYQNCGNFQVDDGEECDEVPTNVNVSCCDRITCKLKRGAVCSDQNSNCCKHCQIADRSKVCYRGVNDCRETTYCNGKSERCPQPPFKLDSTPCYRGLCFNGECKTLCEYHKLTSCLCDLVEDSCKSCCMNTSADDRTCRPYKFADSSSLPDRTPCVQGYCDRGVCVKAGSDTIRRVLQFFRTIGNFEKFMRDNIVGTVLVLSIVIWIPLVCIFQSIEKRQETQEAEKDKWLANNRTDLISQEDRKWIKIIQSKSVHQRTQ